MSSLRKWNKCPVCDEVFDEEDWFGDLMMHIRDDHGAAIALNCIVCNEMLDDSFFAEDIPHYKKHGHEAFEKAVALLVLGAV